MTSDVAIPALPVAAVAVISPLAHLDRPFEYAVPAEFDTAAQPGTRVKVRFAGRDLDGFILERRAVAEHGGRLMPIRRVVGSEPVLTSEVAASARELADAYSGTLGDVLRLAVPTRHARSEASVPAAGDASPHPPAAASPGPWAQYPAGPAMLARIAAGQAPWAAWLALPGQPPSQDWPHALAVAAATSLGAGRGALIVVPDHRDVTRVDAALTAVLGEGQHVRLTADQGQQARYTAFLRVLRGHVRCVVGTRAAAFAPVRDLGLVAVWDDGDDLHDEPRAPYHHVRDILTIRARRTGSAFVAGGFARSVAVAQWLAEGVMAPVAAAQDVVRSTAPRVHVAGEGVDLERDGAAASAHLPSAGWRVAKAALEQGPVLVQVPRRGYLPSLACQDCAEPVRCGHCHGPVALAGPRSDPACRWCGHAGLPRPDGCPRCGSGRVRRGVIGARRTAEELGRAFPGVRVVTSGSGRVLSDVSDEPALVIATPGAEPVAPGGYAAALLLDAWALLDRPELDASLEALRRWCGAAALVRPRASVVVAGVHATAVPAIEALVRWDPAWLAERELTDRVGLRLPPAAAIVQLAGPRPAVLAASAEIAEEGLERLGPLPWGDGVQMLLRGQPQDRARLARAVTAMRAGRSARKEADRLLVRMGWRGQGEPVSEPSPRSPRS